MHTLWNEKRIIIDGNIMCIVSVLARAIRYVSCSMMITRNSHCSKNTHAHTRQKNENYKIVKSKDEMEKYDNKLDRWAAAAKSNNINNRQQSDELQQQARIWCVVCIGIWKTRIFLFPFNIWAAGQLISWFDALSAVSVVVSWDLTLSLCVCVCACAHPALAIHSSNSFNRMFYINFWTACYDLFYGQPWMMT